MASRKVVGMSIEIRHPTADELPGLMRAMGAAFLDAVDPDQRAAFVREYWDLERVWTGADGDRLVGSFRSWPTELTVPGGALLPASAVTAVTVQPTHRRRGILSGM